MVVERTERWLVPKTTVSVQYTEFPKCEVCREPANYTVTEGSYQYTSPSVAYCKAHITDYLVRLSERMTSGEVKEATVD